MKEALGQAAEPLPSKEFLGSSPISLIHVVRLGKVCISYKARGKSESNTFINFLFKLFCNSKFLGSP